MQTTPETVITGDNHAATKGRRCFTGRRINDRGTRGGCQLTDTSSFDALVGKQFSYELLRPLPLSLTFFKFFCCNWRSKIPSSRIFYLQGIYFILYLFQLFYIYLFIYFIFISLIYFIFYFLFYFLY